MASHHMFEDSEGAAPADASHWPPWCVTTHGVQHGEEDWIHCSPPVIVADGLLARTCISIDPETGVTDGPYVLIGGSELTTDETRAVGESLIRLASVDGRAR